MKRYDTLRCLKKAVAYPGGYRGELDIEWLLRYKNGRSFEVFAVRCQNKKCRRWWGWHWDLELVKKTLKRLRRVGRCPVCMKKSKKRRV